jgi:CxxC motif-containing protein (DUF1111 family)
MHDGLSFTFNEAIMRHGGEATFVTVRYILLPQAQKQAIAAFLRSL